jgi:ribosomal protein L37AE/L43A
VEQVKEAVTKARESVMRFHKYMHRSPKSEIAFGVASSLHFRAGRRNVCDVREADHDSDECIRGLIRRRVCGCWRCAVPGSTPRMLSNVPRKWMVYELREGLKEQACKSSWNGEAA